MRRHLLFLSLLFPGACADSHAAPILRSRDVAHAPEPPAGAGEDLGGTRVDFTVWEAAGMPKEEVTRRLSASNSRLRRCLGRLGGKIDVRLTKEGGALRVRVEPSASLDPDGRECVMAALSTIDLEDTGANAALPGPSGFTSLISISW